SPGLAFRIASATVTQPDPDGIPVAVDAPYLRWDPDPIPPPAAGFDRRAPAPAVAAPGRDAQAFLREALAAGPLPAAQLFPTPHERGIATDTLRRAGKALGVRHYRLPKDQDPAFTWVWDLP